MVENSKKIVVNFELFGCRCRILKCFVGCDLQFCQITTFCIDRRSWIRIQETGFHCHQKSALRRIFLSKIRLRFLRLCIQQGSWAGGQGGLDQFPSLAIFYFKASNTVLFVCLLSALAVKPNLAPYKTKYHSYS